MAKYLDMPGLTYFYNQIKNKFASKTDVGAPAVASTVSAMTDHNKIYVYTGSESGYTAGNWYYYDAGSWESGGVYNAAAYVTDKTLSEADKPADAKATGDEVTDLKSALNYKTTKTVTLNTGTYINANTGAIGTNKKYATCVRFKIPEKVSRIELPSDIIVHGGGGASWAIYNSTNGSSTSTFIRSGLTKIIDVQQGDIAISVSTFIPTGSTAPNTIELIFYYSEIGKEINNLSKYKKAIDVCSQEEIKATTLNRYVNYETGEYGNVSTGRYSSTDLIKIPADVYRIEFPDANFSEAGIDGWATYKGDVMSTSAFNRGEKSNYINVTSDDNSFVVSTLHPISTQGIPITVKFIYGKINSIISGIDDLKSNSKYNIVMIGDSIIGNYNGTDSVPAYLADFSGANVFNCAFGGSSMGTDTQGSVNELLLPFRSFKVIEAIVTNNYTEMDDAINNDPSFDNLLPYYPNHVTTLKNIAWDDVDVITISYGINDYLLSVTVEDNASDSMDVNTIGGGLRTALETLWGVYPHIKVIVFGPTWIGGTITDGSLNWDADNRANSIGKFLFEYSEKEKEVAKEYHVPFVEMYNNTNFNSFTWRQYFPINGSNAIHPNAYGRFNIAKRYASFLAQI